MFFSPHEHMGHHHSPPTHVSATAEPAQWLSIKEGKGPWPRGPASCSWEQLKAQSRGAQPQQSMCSSLSSLSGLQFNGLWV